ncbi:MAG: cytochrome c [Vicinamibacteria bacterium]
MAKAKKILKALGWTVLGIVAVAAGLAAYVQLTGIPRYEPEKVAFMVQYTPERVARGRRTVTRLCASCHKGRETGALTGHAMTDAPGVFGWIHSANITQDEEFGIGRYTDSELAYLLRTGITRDGRYTPPWMLKFPLLADEELREIIAFLRSGDPLVRPIRLQAPASRPSFFTKMLTHVAFKPLPYPTEVIEAPPATDRVAYGRYLVQAKLDCYACHSKSFATVDELVPENTVGYLGGGNPMKDRTGGVVHTANLTPDVATGIGSWTYEQFRRTLATGIRPDGRALRSPMTARTDIDDEEAAAIWAYLRTVPALHNPLPTPPALPRETQADAGSAVYYKYGCNVCHGADGSEPHDLRRAREKFPTDDALVDWIRHPERTRPGISMPTWDGMIEEHEYAPLVRFVRALGDAPRRASNQAEVSSGAP